MVENQVRNEGSLSAVNTILMASVSAKVKLDFTRQDEVPSWLCCLWKIQQRSQGRSTNGSSGVMRKGEKGGKE